MGVCTLTDRLNLDRQTVLSNDTVTDRLSDDRVECRGYNIVDVGVDVIDQIPDIVAGSRRR